MSLEDPKITKNSIDGATEIIKEMLHSPIAQQFFSWHKNETPIQRLLNAHQEISTHLSELENRSKIGSTDDFIKNSLSC